MMTTDEPSDQEPQREVKEPVATYRMLPDAVWQELARYRLSGTDQRLLLALMRFSHNGHRAAFPSNASLARMVNASERTVQDRLAKLEARGIVRRTTATEQEAGATHRTIELLFLTFGTSKDSRTASKETGPCNAQETAPGGAQSSAPEEYERGRSTKKKTTRRPSGAVAGDAPPRNGRPRAERPGRAKAPNAAELDAIEARLIEASGAISDALWPTDEDADTEWDHLPRHVTLGDVQGDRVPNTKAAIERMAVLVGELLDDPAGVGTYRKLVSRAVVISLNSQGYLEDDPEKVLIKAVMATLRLWGWGRVTKPAPYFTKRVMAALDKCEDELKDVLGDSYVKTTAKAKSGTTTRPRK